MSGATPEQIAQAVLADLWAKDRASQAMGMEVRTIGPGQATVTMVVRADMLNGHGTCHGGLIAMLADSAFAFACNASNEVTVASGFSIDFVAPVRLGDVLAAHCVEVSRGSRTGVYDTVVTEQGGRCVAVFRGRSYTLKGKAAVHGLTG
jgi:acyl-CoA thioesterase